MTVPAKFASEEVTLNGETKTVEQWCQERGLNIRTVYDRRKRSNWADSLAPAVHGQAFRGDAGQIRKRRA